MQTRGPRGGGQPTWSVGSRATRNVLGGREDELRWQGCCPHSGQQAGPGGFGRSRGVRGPALCSAVGGSFLCDTEVEGKRTSPGEAGVSPSGLDLTLPVSPGAESTVTSGPQGSGASPCPQAAARPQRACGHGSGTRAAALSPRGTSPHPAVMWCPDGAGCGLGGGPWLAVLTPRTCGRTSSPG